LEAGAFQTKFSGPACGNYEFVAVVLFQEYRKTVIAKSFRYITDDLVKEQVEVECGVDLLCHTLQEIEFFNSQNFIKSVEVVCGVARVDHHRPSSVAAPLTSPCQDHFGMCKPSGTSSAEWW